MYEFKLQKLKETAVFSLSDISQIVSGKEYAKKLLKRMCGRGEIIKLKRDAYTFYDDAFLVSGFLVRPSYISSVSALSYYKLITQIPKDIFCFTTKTTKQFNYLGKNNKNDKNYINKTKIQFVNTKYFFGFENKEYMGFNIPIATPEKAVIDSIGAIPLGIIAEAVSSLNIGLIKIYLKKIRKSSVVKRIGFILEKNGFDVTDLKKSVNSKLIYLDPLGKKKGKVNKEWKLIINVEEYL